MNQSEHINELATALSKAQGMLEGAKKDSANPFFKLTYADLSSVWEACRNALSSNGLSVIQSPEDSENEVAIETMLLHSSGQWVKGRYTMPVSKMDAQAVGSALTYAKRYSLASFVGLAPEDDGNAATAAKPISEELHEIITLEQRNILSDLIQESNTEIAAFCKYFNVGSIREIQTKHYSDAISMLTKKIGKNLTKKSENVVA